MPRRGSWRAGGMMAAATASPWAAQAAEAGGGTGSLLLAVVVGAAVALVAAAVVLRTRDRRAAAPPHEALAAGCAFWWRTDPSGRIVETGPGRLAAGASTESLRGRLLWDPSGDGSTLEAIETTTPIIPDRWPAYWERVYLARSMALII